MHKNSQHRRNAFIRNFFDCTTFAGIATKDKDTFKLIGTSFAYNGKFAWIELNGEDYGWTREGENVGKYRIVLVDMGKVLVESNKKTVLLLMLGGYTI